MSSDFLGDYGSDQMKWMIYCVLYNAAPSKFHLIMICYYAPLCLRSCIWYSCDASICLFCFMLLYFYVSFNTETCFMALLCKYGRRVLLLVLKLTFYEACYSPGKIYGSLKYVGVGCIFYIRLL